jgi:hypothetical protein
VQSVADNNRENEIMSEDSLPESQQASQTQAKLRQLAVSLREAEHLDPETQKALANLLDELGTELESAGLASPRTAHLAEAASEVARSLHEQHPTDQFVTARDRLKEAAVQTEVEAPVTTGVVYRMLDVLASIGI